MPDTVTPKLNLIKPEIGASSNTWGNKVNGNMDVIDQKMVRQSIQWTVATGDDNPTSSVGSFVVTRYGNDGLRIDDPFAISRQSGDGIFNNNLYTIKQILMAAGSAAAPALAFAAEAALGFYRTLAGHISFTGRLVGDGAVPAGAIMDFGMPTPPSGWLACDGQALATASYPDLFNAIGYTWGGSGGTFFLPNALSGSRFRRHRDNSTYGGAVGNYQNTTNLTHTHTVIGGTSGESNDHQHYISGTTGTDYPDHTHSYQRAFTSGAQKPSSGGSAPFDNNTPDNTGGASTRHQHDISFWSGGVNQDHSHSINFASGATGDPNESRPYSMTVLTCIKA